MIKNTQTTNTGVNESVDSGNLMSGMSEIARACANITKERCSRLMAMIPRLSVEPALWSGRRAM